MAQILDLVRVVNTGDTDLVLRGNTVYTIPAGKDRIIPFPEAASWFGDPRLQNVGRDKMRDLAYRQVQAMWGYTEGMQYPKDNWQPHLGVWTWEDFKPKAECYDMEGNRIFMVIDDPNGEHAFNGPELIDPATQDNSTLTKQIAEMQRQIALLTTALAQANVVPPAATEAPAADSFDGVNLPQPTEDENVGDDAPRTVKAGKSK